MSKKELKQAMKKVKFIFVWTILSKEDGAYLEIKKGSLLHHLKNSENGEEYNAEIREGEKESLYIN